MLLRITYIVLISLCCTLVSGQESEIKWYTIEEAIELAQQNNKKIFIEVYTDWCKWCKRLDETTFKDERIISMINESFYPVKFDAEMQRPIIVNNTEYKFVKFGKLRYHQFAAELTHGRLNYPSLVFIDESIKILQSVGGYRDADGLSMLLSYYAKNYHKRTPWHNFLKKENAAVPVKD